MSRLDNFERGPMTASSADYLAGLYGQGASIDEFARSLPQDARVADIGAGLSDFGHQVATLRPDVSWTNVDLNYAEDRHHPQHELFRKAQDKAPENLHAVAASALALPAELRGQDIVCSYNLLTHFRRINFNLGHQALTSMVELLNDEGQLMVGPTNAKMATSERWNVTALSAGATPEEIAHALKLLTASRPARLYYNAADASGVSLFPARRFGDQGRLVVSDDGGQTRHTLASKQGVTMVARLALGLFHWNKAG